MQRAKRLMLAVGFLLAVFVAIGSFSQMPHNAQTGGNQIVAKESPNGSGFLAEIPPRRKPKDVKVTGYKYWMLTNTNPEMIPVSIPYG